MAAIVVGELPRSFDPAVSEWGNPPRKRYLNPNALAQAKSEDLGGNHPN